MYAIAQSVNACIRGGTRVDVAWNLSPQLAPTADLSDAVGITPGGGRLGQLLGGAFDSRLVELAAARPSDGRILTFKLTTLEAQQLDAEEGAEFRLLVTPAEALPTELWEVLIERRPVQIVAKLDQDRVTEFELGPDPSSTSVEDSASAIRTSWSPTPLLVVLGAGPMATAIADAGQLVGWRVETGASTEQALGLAASLSPIDSLVVMGHNTENVGRVLQSALGSRAGYIGSVGPASLQEDRGDWLAYRGITDTSRIHGPAGVPIGANSPGEIAISVLAEALAVHNSQGI